jgi:hypothetical protein
MSDNKFNFGFGIRAFQDEEFNMDEYHDYGQIKLFYERWDRTDDVFIPIKTKPCDKNIFPKPGKDG